MRRCDSYSLKGNLERTVVQRCPSAVEHPQMRGMHTHAFSAGKRPRHMHELERADGDDDGQEGRHDGPGYHVRADPPARPVKWLHPRTSQCPSDAQAMSSVRLGGSNACDGIAAAGPMP